MFEEGYFERLVNGKILEIHTAYLAKVLSVKGTTARLQPLTKYKAVGGNAKTSSTTEALIPPNIKFKTEKITYLISNVESETKTVIVPAKLEVGDIVFVGVCDRDISNAKNGVINEATQRHHNINDGVILRVVR